MKSFSSRINPKDRQYARLAHHVLAALQKAVEYRLERGERKSQLAAAAGMHPTSLSRILHGRVSNLTIRTISDILWAARFEPQNFDADAYEVISPNAHAWAAEPLPSLTVPAESAPNVVCGWRFQDFAGGAAFSRTSGFAHVS